MNIFYWFVIGTFKIYFTLFHRLKIYGRQNLPKGSAIIAPNHTSFFDPPIIAASCGEEATFLAKSSLFKHFIFGRLISWLNAYPVAGTAQDISSLKLIGQLLKENKKVVIFPEGIRSDDGVLLPIKSGIGMLALRANSPIVPVYIHGAYDVWDKSRKFPKFWGKIACVFGKPIYMKDFEQYGKKEAQEKISQATENEIKALKAWYLTHYTKKS